MSPTASETPRLPSDQFGAKHTSLPGVSEEGRTPRGGHATLDDSFVRHDTYFFKDGNVTFLIDDTLYCVHRFFFSRDSTYFSERFSKLGIRDHEALPIVISIDDVENDDFEALLSVLYPANFEAHELSYKQWKSVLHLSTRWGFASLRELALKSIEPLTSYDQLVLARTYSVEHWVLPALTALCSRTLPLSLDEARQMSVEDVVLVATVREEIRDGTLRVDAADIPLHVELAQAIRVSKVYSDKLKSGSTRQESSSTMASAVDLNAEAGIAKTMRMTPGPHQRATKEGSTNESDIQRSEVPVDLPSRSRFWTGPVRKSANTSTADALSDRMNTNSTSGYPVEAPSGETQKGGTPQEAAYTKDSLTVKTEVPVATDAVTAGPSTVGNLPEGDSEGGEGCQEVVDDEWAIPMKVKKKKPITPIAPGDVDDWAVPSASVKKKKKKPVTPIA